MFFPKTCDRCQSVATWVLNDRLLCTEHALEAIQQHKGRIERPKAIR